MEFFSNFILVRKIIELYCQTFKNDMKMKKQLLIGSALLLAISVNSQNSRQFRPVTGIVNMDAKMKANKLANGSAYEAPVTNANKFSNPSPEVGSDNSTANSASSPIISATFTRFSGSMNVFGMLVSNQKALQYNRLLRTFSFIQRKSPTYITNPALPANAQSGAIVAYLGKNDGASWDSTLLFSDASNWSRYPQGAIYNPPTNTSATYTNAYVVGSGPCTSAANSWVGSWFASKKLTSPGTNSVGPDVQFMPNTAPFNNATSPAMKKQDFPRYSFAATEDGMVRSLGNIANDINGTTNTAYGLRGAAMNKGVFTSGVFVWSYDSFIPPVVVRTVNEPGTKSMWGTPYMAWNDAGTVGYVMFVGSRVGSTNQNVGWQPIIYKTTTSGNAWALVNGIDFNQPTIYDKLLNSMNGPNTNTNISIPFFKSDEGIDLVVDNSNKLHIVTTAVGSARQHPDSVEYTWQYPKGTENMSWFYANTAWPYVVDFSGDGTGNWAMKVIDSLGTEGPSSTSGQPGFGSNPWSNQSQANPVTSDSRIQISRSYDGEFITYSWAESDTTLTTGATKWNEFPNIHQRALRLCDGAVSTDELIISSPSTGFNNRVRDKAYFHFMGSTCKAGGSTMTSATFTVPYTVSNNVATDGGVPVDNFFSSAVVTHNFPSSACGATVTTGLAAAKTEASQSFIYPNPTDNLFNVRLNLSNSNDISVEVFNAIGQKVTETKVNGQVGENNVPMNMNNATAGVYFVKIKVGKTESTKKLVIK
jgi:hypothetical protein